MEKITIAFIDDHVLVRDAIVAMINKLGNYKVVLTADNGLDFINKLKTAPALPQLALVDMSMPIMDGFETIKWISENHPQIKSIALTFDQKEPAIIRILKLGARGFLLKNITPEALELAFDEVCANGYYHTEFVKNVVFNNSISKHIKNQLTKEEIMNEVTPKEIEFLKYLCSPEEHTYDDIAKKMGVNKTAIDYYRRDLCDKFELKSKTGLVVFAIKWGLVDIDEV